MVRLIRGKSEAEQSKGCFYTRERTLQDTQSSSYLTVLSYIVLNYASIVIPNIYLPNEDTQVKQEASKGSPRPDAY